MEGQIVLLRQIKDADQIDRVTLEYIGLGKPNSILVDDEIVALGKLASLDRTQTRHHAAEHRNTLGVAVLEFGAKDGREIADVLGDQEVVLHKSFDILQAGVFGVAQPHGYLALNVERKTFFGAAHQEVHVTPHRPEEILAATEQLIFLLVEDASLDQLVRLAHAVDIFGNPEQRVQIAYSTLAVLHVCLDQISRLPAAADAIFAFGELCRDKIGGGVANDTVVKARNQFVEQFAVAEIG